ncbi:MAG: [acyl-carrier-protein] S-malonyltransferase [Chloroflexi bacterium RBG_13_54_8]|nr:MAG: [acyl-carrier-protein] S-malonyltransferase [Chloroflexi bacterium RBG_13_54_8]
MLREGKVAYVFPGQGSQRVGMGRDLYDSSPQARAVFEEADSVLGFPITELCFEGPQELLRQTQNAQPAILVVSVAYLKASPQLQGIVPAFVAGHSLGEYTALVAAHVLDFAEALYLARERGRLMQESGDKVPGGMVAILGLEEDSLDEVCQSTGAQVANINCPGQIVISGAAENIARAAELTKAKGARSVVPLQVSGAFHTRLMEPAVEGMSQAISRIAFRDPLVPVIANTTARLMRDGEAVKAELLHQLCHCVQWQRSVEHMIQEGVSTFFEVGPGQVLTGLIKRTSKEVEAISLEGRRER